MLKTLLKNRNAAIHILQFTALISNIIISWYEMLYCEQNFENHTLPVSTL